MTELRQFGVRLLIVALCSSLMITEPWTSRPAEAYLAGWLRAQVAKRKKVQRDIEREQKRKEREAARQQREAESLAKHQAAEERRARLGIIDLPPRLRDQRRRMLVGRTIPLSDMRAIADLGDGVAAFRLARRLEKLQDPGQLGDAVKYYSRAARTGRDYALRPMMRLLTQGGAAIPQARVQLAEKAFLSRATAGSMLANEILATSYRSGEPFGKKPEQVAIILRRLVDHGSRQAALDLAISLMSSGTADAQSQTRIVAYLTLAAKSDQPGQRAMAETLLQRVKLQSAQTVAEPTQ